MSKFFKTLAIVYSVLAGLMSCNPGNDSENTTGKPVPKEDPLIFYTAGFILPNAEYHAQQAVGKKWGIAYQNLGCDLYPGLNDTLQNRNDRTEAALTTKYGVGWKQNFERELKEYEIEWRKKHPNHPF